MTVISRRTALAATVGLAAAPAVARAASPAWAAVDQACAKIVSDKLSPGVQAAVFKGGVVIYSKGFGAANLETSTAMSPASVLHIGSITKQFTAAVMLRLQEQGELNVDDRLSKYLPDFPRAGDVTLRQMLTHTSGLGNYTDTPKPEIFMQRSRTDYDAAALQAAMAGTDPLFIGKPGEQWAYSNSAFVLLGLVVQKAAGRPYGEVFGTEVLGPAGLVHTAVDDNAEIVPNRASGYSANAKAPSGFDNASYISMTYPGAAGSMRSTSEDLCRWHRALLVGGRILKPESLKTMTTPVRLANGAQPTAAMAPPPAEAKPVDYGMGLFIAKDAHGTNISHGGGIQGFLSYVGSYPDADVQVAYVVNADNHEVAPAMQVLQKAMIEAAFGA